MQFKYLNKIIVNSSKTVKNVLNTFNSTAQYTDGAFIIVVNDQGACVGVVTDGDIRRILTNKDILNLKIHNIMNKDFTFVNKNDDHHTVLRKFDLRVKNLPVLNDKGLPLDLYVYSKFVASSRSKTRIIRARAPVRVSYSGGGTDMSNYINKYSSFVLSSTINKYCTSSIIMRDDSEIHINSKDLDLKYSAKNIHEIKYGDKLDLIKAAIKIMQPDYGFDIETYAEFDPGTGLGGSSAVVVSVLGALNYFRNDKQLDIYQIADLAYQVERIEMDIYGGWQDQYATTFGGFSWIEFRKDEVLVNPLKLQRNTLLELEYNLMLFKLGSSRSSSRIQEKLIKKINKNILDAIFKDMNEISIKMKEAILKGKVKQFADLLHESWILKQKMNQSVSNKKIEDCYNICRKIGALGGKLLGAGQSGYLLIYSSPLYQKKIIRALEKKGVYQEPFKFSNIGLEVWSTER
tara:strand:+ start:33712 stop:35094 length:1383 start_codon:yes stop_codon:yes gene_type:complete